MTSIQRKLTGLFMVIGLGGLAIWDWFVAHNDIKGDTISEISRDISINIYLLPYVCGVVMGHLFWNAPDRERMNLKIITASTAAVAAFDASGFGHFVGGNLLALAGGVLMGARYWPQTIAPSPELEEESEEPEDLDTQEETPDTDEQLV